MPTFDRSDPSTDADVHRVPTRAPCLPTIGRAQAGGHWNAGALVVRTTQVFLQGGHDLDYALTCTTRARQTAFLVPGLTLVVRATSADCRGHQVRTGRTRRCSSTTRAASRSSVEYLAPDRVPGRRCWRLEGFRSRSRETVPVLDSEGTPGPRPRSSARLRRRHRAAVGDRLRERSPQLLRQHHRDAQGWYPRRRASSKRC